MRIMRTLGIKTLGCIGLSGVLILPVQARQEKLVRKVIAKPSKTANTPKAGKFLASGGAEESGQTEATQKGEKDLLTARLIAANGPTDDKAVFQQLMIWGQKYEAEHQYKQAMCCYQAAALVDKAAAQMAMEELAKKVKKFEEQKQRNAEIHALIRGMDAGNAEDAFKLGKMYWEQGAYEEAVKVWEKASELKHPEAAYNVARLYEKGDHVEVNLAKAEQFYAMGAQNGHPECMYITAKLWEVAAQSPLNSAKASEARKLKEEAANRGHVLAAAEIGFTYSSEGDHEKARFYFKKAYDNADPQAVMTLRTQQIMAYVVAAERLRTSPVTLARTTGYALGG